MNNHEDMKGGIEEMKETIQVVIEANADQIDLEELK
jgi:hypothetical protein